MKKLAILHSGDLGNVSIGGVSQYIQEIIRHEKEYEVTLFGTCESGKYTLGKEYEKELDGHKYIFIPVTDDSIHPLSINYYFKIHKYLKKIGEYDVIYCQRMEYIIPFLFRKSKVNTVMAVHGSGAYTVIWRGKLVAFFYNLLERLAMNIAGKVIVLQKREEFGVPYYKRRYKKNANKVFFGKVPIDEDVFYTDESIKAEKDNHIFSLVYLGRIDNNPKRVLLFPDIVKKLVTDDIPVKMTMIGDGPSMDDLRKKISDYGIEQYFDIKGKINHGKELTDILNKSDLAFIISSFEGICMSALECIACGVPVIATDVGDIKEYIKENKNGIIIPNATEEEIIDACVKSTYDIYKNGCAMNDIYKNYSANTMIKELNDIFERTV